MALIAVVAAVPAQPPVLVTASVYASPDVPTPLGSGTVESLALLTQVPADYESRWGAVIQSPRLLLDPA
jgi:hypothetical protein